MAQQKLTFVAVAGGVALVLIAYCVYTMTGRGPMRQGDISMNSEPVIAARALLDTVMQSPGELAANCSKAADEKSRKEMEAAIRNLAECPTIKLQRAARVDDYIVIAVEGRRADKPTLLAMFVFTEEGGRTLLVGLQK